jgi:hypothetical protein
MVTNNSDKILLPESENEPFNQLIQSYNSEKDLNEAFEKGFHFHWISYSHSLLTELIKSFILIKLNSIVSLGKLKRSQDFKDYIHSLGFRDSISFLHFNGIIGLDLYNDLKKVNSQRNLVLHNLIFKIEKVNELNLKEYFDLCNNSIKSLVAEMLRWVQFHSAIQGDLIKSFD